jgi:hypothetical protein
MSPAPPFEKAEQLPPAPQTSGSFLRNSDEWIGRCRARMLQLGPLLRTDEADALVWDSSQLESYRHLAPEDAAEQIYRCLMAGPGKSDEP